ncbi:MAG: ChbG/HpnK family deacetylase [Candidatus Omnitrophica bacterium]|nr:ChbG/HpnK family deacetylase [Candidatus Omnitrophota bacterium]
MNADDFGLDPGINRGIEEVCLAGTVRSVSLVATGGAFDDAVERLPRMPGVGVGIHLCLVGERSVLSQEKIPSLVDEGDRFPEGYSGFLLRWWRRRISSADIAQELEAQFLKILAYGVRLTHADGHQYLHLIPGVLEIVIGLCKKYGVKWIRYPRRIERGCPASLGAAAKKLAQAALAPSQVKRMADAGIRGPDRSLGFLESGRLDARRMSRLLGQAEAGINDLTVHPGHGPRSKRYVSGNFHRERELAVLKDEAIMHFVREAGITVGNYAERS